MIYSAYITVYDYLFLKIKFFNPFEAKEEETQNACGLDLTV